jgi:DNA repair protein RecN (Recombination protein N)
MLVELAVRDLGVIESARITLAPGATALTGETGAGKTMVVEALQLVCGSRADPQRVRPGAAESVVEALFVAPPSAPGEPETEFVVRRVVPVDGRSRAYVDDALVPVGRLAELTEGFVEIHGQHSQQGLLSTGAQRAALDRFGGVDTTVLEECRAEVRRLEADLESLGGDPDARQRELELLRHQVAELDGASPEAGEDERLELEEDLLDGAVEHRAAGDAAIAALVDDAGVADRLAQVVASIAGRSPYADLTARLDTLAVELTEVTSDLRRVAESIEVDDARLAAVRERRQLLADLRRRHGVGSTDELVEFAEELRGRLGDLEGLLGRAEALDEELRLARARLADEAGIVGDARREAAPRLAAAVEATLQRLALPSCRVRVQVDDDPALPGAGGRVEVLLAANPGAPPAPLARVASGGELSRVMLALRLVGSGGPATMVFDEVDAGIGGEAANAVAAALSEVADEHQVLLVTHLAQIASVADAQVLVEKTTDGSSTTTGLRPLDRAGRVVELSRMLSGSPDSEVARQHAEELLASREGVGR